ncbi:NAD(P)H-dependent oxidoreductase [Spirosoma sp. RP8]|uniref:NAD(P)H-dependent oxidoreductase n=1 Tax=Spirosoma liriopis TaxID=2937440 RepID=A0ABT0HGJ9_9BACT|nr:NAD(P)H-dependent oxidoreductase [Spirosoma liriopis]MCK8491296.1 NAD(P)H-dependent oxidoreductase [Spirosoma liriopis]
MARILIQFAHPALSKSQVHRVLIDYCRNQKNVTVNDLYESYPDMFIDVDREQKLVLQNDIILFQFPLYWYSSPAIIKQWFDLVLEHNWAYGSRGNALAGKKMGCIISCGGGPDTYLPTGRNHYPVDQFLLPFEQTARLCKMEYLPPFVVYGTFHITKEVIRQSGEQYQTILSALANDRLNALNYQEATYFNELLPDLQTVGQV